MTFDSRDAIDVYFFRRSSFNRKCLYVFMTFFWHYTAVKGDLRKLAYENGFEFDPIAWQMNRNKRQISLHADESVHRAATLFRKYNRTVLPVVDADRQLLGILTVDDILYLHCGLWSNRSTARRGHWSH